jgi:diguanylate cyclase (GGDEF)-like protein
MKNDVLFAFGAFQFTFLLLDFYVIGMTNRDIARKGEHTWFRALVLTHMLYLVLNTLWTMNEYDLITIPRNALVALTTISVWTVTNCATSFFLFVVEKLDVHYLQNRSGKWIRQIPAFITTVLIATSPLTGLVTQLSEEGYFVHGPIYLPTVALSSLYLVYIAALALSRMLKNKTSFQRRAHGALLVSVLIIILFIVADGFFAKASILPAAIFAVILVIFVTLQQSNINSDALTGMNNRRRAEAYLSDRLTAVSGEDPLILYIGDLDSFKKINDTYGHIQGDEALIIASRALMEVAAKYDAFAARFGGDEFLFAWRPGKDNGADPEGLMEEVNALMAEYAAGKPFKIHMTSGFVTCTNPKIPLTTCIERADEMLYRNKAAARVGR